MRLRVLDDLGGAKLSEITRLDLQDLVDRLLGEGLDPSTIRNALMPLRAIYRRALLAWGAVNPTSGLDYPPFADGAIGSRRRRSRGAARRAPRRATAHYGRPRSMPASARGELAALR